MPDPERRSAESLLDEASLAEVTLPVAMPGRSMFLRQAWLEGTLAGEEFVIQNALGSPFLYCRIGDDEFVVDLRSLPSALAKLRERPVEVSR